MESLTESVVSKKVMSFHSFDTCLLLPCVDERYARMRKLTPLFLLEHHVAPQNKPLIELNTNSLCFLTYLPRGPTSA